MSIENEIAGLTQSTTDLLEAVNTKKATLDTAVSNAQTAVIDATSQVSLAAAEKVGAQTARDTAESFKDQAYTYSQSAASAVAYQDLTAIAQTKAETAVDVFVYDTSKDSDGGAWRHRTQHTSWYNETLNTATRGSRKEFPAVAVIVAETNKVTIYDGDDPTLPMWRVTSAITGVTPQFWRTGRSAKSTYAINGKVAIGLGTDTAAGLAIIDFPADLLIRWSDGGTADGLLSGVSNDTSVTATLSGTLPSLVNNTVNDVAMTVLPDAPIDPATGLPIPTIAVATNGGVSVITDSGAVYDGSWPNTVSRVSFDKYGRLFWARGSDILYLSETYSSDGHGVLLGTVRDWGGIDLLTSIMSLQVLPNGFSTASRSAYPNTTAVAGLSSYYSNSYSFSNNLSNLVTSTYNTGWMNGDIKLATLSDTDDTDLVGSELVTNGTFDTDISGWVAYGNATIQESNNELLATMQTNSSGARVTIPTEVGKTYYVVVDVTSISSGNTQFKWNLDNSQRQFTATPKTISGYYTATSTTTSVEIGANSDMTFPSTITIDNISVRLAEPDRSVNNNGLQVFGTVQKNPVATGADLVAYSGFSDSNYLMQPYNSDLDFGTGDFCVTGWFYQTSSANTQYIILRKGTATKFALGVSSSNAILFVLNGAAYATSPSSTYSDEKWNHFVALRNASGTFIYLNGSLIASAGGEAVDVTDTSASLYIGDGANTTPFIGSLALLRISATAPTAEQIKKIYEDEKVLFQENAQATLHGTSDAVTALAYDTDTELLHVGTSGGRSVFQGLERVDNTTDAVGVAISASNGFVVEE